VISVPKDNASDARQELAALRADKQRLATEFAQAWKDLKKARADAQAAAVELVSLHARVADLEAAIAATAKDHADCSPPARTRRRAGLCPTGRRGKIPG